MRPGCEREVVWRGCERVRGLLPPPFAHWLRAGEVLASGFTSEFWANVMGGMLPCPRVGQSVTHSLGYCSWN